MKQLSSYSDDDLIEELSCRNIDWAKLAKTSDFDTHDLRDELEGRGFEVYETDVICPPERLGRIFQLYRNGNTRWQSEIVEFMHEAVNRII